MKDQLIYKSLLSIMEEIGVIGKDKKNTMQNYNFRGIDDMYNALHPLFTKFGVFITSEVLNGEREERQTKSGGLLIYSIIDVKFTFHALDGSSVSSVIKGEGMDSGDKATNKAISTALKYALMQMFLIPTLEKIDTEYDSPEPKPKDNRTWINEKLVEKVIERIKSGDNTAKDNAIKTYQISPEFLKRINEA